MIKPCRHIGFNDRWLMLIGIPLLSFIIPFVFFNCSYSRPPLMTWSKFLSTTLITATIWIGNRNIMIYSRKRYPSFALVKKRIRFQALVMFSYTILASMVLGMLLERFFVEDEVIVFTWTDKLVHANSASLFCTIMIIAIYESVYFMGQLSQSIEEQEHLKRESLNAQLNALRTQVNPHFLFNNLNTLVSLIPENQQQATQFVQQLSRVYRHILEVREEQHIPLRDELDVLKSYAFLLHTRFGNNLQIRIEVSDLMLGHHIVPLSLQLLMENAIKHNIVSADKPLIISVFINGTNLVMENNLQPKRQLNESTGIGLENISNRYRLITNRKVFVSSDAAHFRVELPLLEQS